MKRRKPVFVAVGVAALLTACLRWAGTPRDTGAVRPLRAANALDLLMPADLKGMCQDRLGAMAGGMSTIEDIVKSWGRRTTQLSGYGSGLQGLRERRYFIAAMHRNGGGGTFAPAGWQRELLKLVYTLGNTDLSNIFVSIYESHGDLTQMGPSNDLDALLNGLGVPHALVRVIELEAHPDRDTLPRVEFLARLQNLALLPLLESETDFDSVLYISDVMFCAADAIDLLRAVDSRGGINADLSCSVDYITRDPSQPQQDETRLHDTWAAHDMLGVNMVNDHPYMCHADGQSSFDRGEPFEVFSCWNGMVALDADVFQRLGARFRSARNYECQLSESELLARDMRVLGRGRIVMVPTAKVAYSGDVFKAVALPENKGLPEPLALRGPAVPEPKDAMCCSIDRSRSRVLLETCVTQRRWRLPYEAFGVPVAPSRAELHIGALDLVPRGKAGLDAARERFAATTPALAAAAAAAATFQIPQRIVQWGGKSEGWADDGQTLLEMSSLSYLAANQDLQLDVISDTTLAAWTTRYARSAEFSRGVTHAFRSAALRLGFQRLLYMFDSGGIFVPTASWGGAGFAEVLKPEDQAVLGVAVDRRSGERHLLYLAAAPRSTFLEAAVEASRAALRLPEATYRRMWAAMPHEGSLEELEGRFFTGAELLVDLAQRMDFAGVRVVEYDLAVVTFDVGRPEAVCAKMEGRKEILALVLSAGSVEEAADSPVYFDPQMPSRLVFTGSLGEEQRVGTLRNTHVSQLKTSNHMLAGQYLRAAADSDKSFAPLTAMAPLEECRVSAAATDASPDSRCFLFHSPRGELAIYRGMGLADPGAKLVSLLAAPPAHSHYASDSGARGRQPTQTFTYLVLQDDGNLVLYGADGEAAAPAPLWGAGWAFPADCPVDSECRRLAYVALGSDGRLALHRGVSPAMQAYLEVGAAALERLWGCLHVGDVMQFAMAVRNPSGKTEEACTPPRALKLVALPKSGAEMTMEAVMEATGATVYTADEEDVEIAGEDTPEKQELCGNNACQDLGMCQLGLGQKWGDDEEGEGTGEGLRVRQPAPGKGALLKARSDSYGPADVGGASEGLAAYATALARGAFALPVDQYGFLHLMRNPFDHLVARFRARAPASSAARTESMGSRAMGAGEEIEEMSSLWSGSMYDQDAFLSDNGRFPKRDIFTYLYWHLSMNVLFKGSGLPTATLTYESIYQDPVGYLQQVVGFLGYNQTEIARQRLAQASNTFTGHRYAYHRGKPVPAYLDSFYDSDTVEYISSVINEVLDQTECLSKAVFPVPARDEPAPGSVSARYVRDE